MIRALLYLRLMGLRNRAVSMALRLRQPKYLVGALAGVAYFFFVFGHRYRAGPMSLPPLIGAFVLLLLVLGRLVFAWLSPEENPGLRFSEADICFLFPAPMTRLMLIQYNILSSQFSILLSALFLTLIANRSYFLGGTAAMHAAGWWVILTTINLQFTGAPLTVAQLTQRGVRAPRRRAILLCALGLFVAATAIAMARHERPAPPANFAIPAETAYYAIGFVDVGPMHWVLALLKIVCGPFLAPDGHAFLLAIGPALLVLLAQYVWVVRMETSFEDGSIALAHRTAEFMAARREGRRMFSRAPTRARGEPFRLSGRAPAEAAFLWKNLTSTWSGFNPRTVALSAVAILVVCGWLRHEPFGPGALRFLGWAAAVMSGYTLLLGPQYARQDLRGDLSHADMLKAYPLAGWRIVLGELLAPVAILTALLWLELLVFGLALPFLNLPWMTAAEWAPTLVCLAAVFPFVAAMQLIVPNAAVLLFPGWAQMTPSRTAGIDAMGQRMIFMLGQMLATIVALVPAALAAAILFIATQWLVGTDPALALAAVGVLAILGGELWVGVWWLGERFEKFDLAT